jgi:hypothetical protein
MLIDDFWLNASEYIAIMANQRRDIPVGILVEKIREVFD